jgi:hypothetical protein
MHFYHPSMHNMPRHQSHNAHTNTQEQAAKSTRERVDIYINDGSVICLTESLRLTLPIRHGK